MQHSKPFLRWVGGKTWARDFIYHFWTTNQQEYFIEPFAGGISSTLYCQPKKAILNDINPHLINLYQQIKNGLEITIPFENTRECYLSNRENLNKNIKNNNIETKECAELFYYLNKTCFNGLCRFSKKEKKFNVPFGDVKTKVFLKDLSKYTKIFEKYEFTCSDFESLSSNKYPDATWIIDSPYDDSFTGYSPEQFNTSDQFRNIDWAAKLDGPVLLMNKGTDLILEYLAKNNFEFQLINKKHMVGASGKARKNIKEVFAWKNAKLPEKYKKGENWKLKM